MRRLSCGAFDRASEFLKTQARPLERALFEHHFKGAPGEAVMAELARFQNEDGGFGHALEPDLRTPNSSALATGIGLRILREVRCSVEHPMVRRAIRYVLETFDAEARVWCAVPNNTHDFPHAPWWHDEGGSLARTFDGFVIIPRAELVGSLHHYRELVSADWLEDLTEQAVSAVETIEPLGTGGGDDLVYALRLAETAEVPQGFRDRLRARIRAVVPNVVARDPREWASYSILPLKVAPSPGSMVADLISDALEAHLDYQIEHQSPEGTWDPVWTWDDGYSEAWTEAEREWRGCLTLETLLALRAFGRIEL